MINALVISEDLVEACGGVLPALVDASAAYGRTLLEPKADAVDEPDPSQLILHKEPHLDEYTAAFFLRCSQDPEARRVRLVERTIHWAQDKAAEAEWPYSAVIGFGGGRTESRCALAHFDEHNPSGGRYADSCTDLVFDRRLEAWSQEVELLRQEVSAIDSRGGAHPFHLNNIMKTVHQVQYEFGENDTGQQLCGKLSASWKRALVDGLLSAVLWCHENGIDITDRQYCDPDRDLIFERIAAMALFADVPENLSQLGRLKQACGANHLKTQATIEIEGEKRPQVLLLPFLMCAACRSWGLEIALLLVSPLVEAIVKSNIGYNDSLELARHCWKQPGRARSITPRGKGMSLYIDKCRTAVAMTQQRAQPWDKKKFNPNFKAQLTPIVILHCVYTDSATQPHKGFMAFINGFLHGVGVLLMEHANRGSKAIFKGNSIEQDQWSTLTRALEEREPGIWYLVNETAPFIVNGNAAHPQPMSNLDAKKIAAILDKEL